MIQVANGEGKRQGRKHGIQTFTTKGLALAGPGGGVRGVNNRPKSR